MRTRLARRFSGTALAVAAGVVVSLITALPQSANAVAADGLECETANRGTGTVAYTLTAKSGYVFTPDGNSIYMWGYAGPSGAFQLPGPILCVNEGDTVSVTLNNTLADPVSMVFPGQAAVLADGQPDAPALAAVPPTMAKPAPKLTGSVTYSFVASHPGTYLYESGTDQRKQVQMGLYGALIVYPAAAPMGSTAPRAYNSADTLFRPTKEYLHLLSEVDPAIHLAVEKKRAVNWNAYKPRYFFINGRSMPDTLAPNRASYLPSQPYSGFVHINPHDQRSTAGLDSYNEPALIRYVNAGTITYPFHPHGNSQRVIARDGRELKGAALQDLTYDKFLLDVGPGQTLDTLLTWTDIDLFNPSTNSLDDKVTIPALADQMITGTTFYSQSPYLGFTSDAPQGVTSYNSCGEYYHVAHSHALQQSTNYGAAMGGMMTLIRIDPPVTVQAANNKPCQ
jgi:FtsP/CotA-like multicopper oxidase with cupredoxin domain